jgi:hypothetical protein
MKEYLFIETELSDLERDRRLEDKSGRERLASSTFDLSLIFKISGPSTQSLRLESPSKR